MQKTSIESIARTAGDVLSHAWKAVYDERKDELTEMFIKFGGRAYGAWIQQFMAPVAERLAADGFLIRGGFNRNDSMENWGPPEERERCVWYVVKSAESGEALGTLVLQVYHSHRSFFMPRAPRLLPIEVTDREAIIAALSDASTRIRWDLKEERMPQPEFPGQRYEYATDTSIGDGLKPAADGQLYSWNLDDALGHWGRYGWELVSVVPTGDKVIAYFRRPLTESFAR
ncbi:DUF6022 family protein [Paenibacillus sp. SI8]|uniref:DUF6022 family protein n=1 Tax=unclassified Paenibacillus TaxID=185978 RepID=UPI003466D26A